MGRGSARSRRRRHRPVDPAPPMHRAVEVRTEPWATSRRPREVERLGYGVVDGQLAFPATTATTSRYRPPAPRSRRGAAGRPATASTWSSSICQGRSQHRTARVPAATEIPVVVLGGTGGVVGRIAHRRPSAARRTRSSRVTGDVRSLAPGGPLLRRVRRRAGRSGSTSGNALPNLVAGRPRQSGQSEAHPSRSFGPGLSTRDRTRGSRTCRRTAPGSARSAGRVTGG